MFSLKSVQIDLRESHIRPLRPFSFRLRSRLESLDCWTQPILNAAGVSFGSTKLLKHVGTLARNNIDTLITSWFIMLILFLVLTLW